MIVFKWFVFQSYNYFSNQYKFIFMMQMPGIDKSGGESYPFPSMHNWIGFGIFN